MAWEVRKTERTILHVDCNAFYASVECLYHPELRARPVAVGGDAGKRHGIILAKNQQAKVCGVTTGEALWQARQKCPDLVILPPDYGKYIRFSRLCHWHLLYLLSRPYRWRRPCRFSARASSFREPRRNSAR